MEIRWNPLKQLLWFSSLVGSGRFDRSRINRHVMTEVIKIFSYLNGVPHLENINNTFGEVYN